MAIVDPATGRSDFAHRLMLSLQEWTCQESILKGILRAAGARCAKAGLSAQQCAQEIKLTQNRIAWFATRIRQTLEPQKLSRQQARRQKANVLHSMDAADGALTEEEIKLAALEILGYRPSRHAVIRYVDRIYGLGLRNAAKDVNNLAKAIYTDVNEGPTIPISLVSQEKRAD